MERDSSSLYSPVNLTLWFNPFSSYGEGLFLTIQTSLIGFLILFFGGNAVGAFSFGAVYIGIMGYLLSGLCPLSVLGALQSINIPIVILSKVSLTQTNVAYVIYNKYQNMVGVLIV